MGLAVIFAQFFLISVSSDNPEAIFSSEVVNNLKSIANTCLFIWKMNARMRFLITKTLPFSCTGKGNTAFETASHIYGNTGVIHMMSRSRLRLAWETHYVGDLRAVNNGLLDTYQLKTLDGLFESDIEVKSVKFIFVRAKFFV